MYPVAVFSALFFFLILGRCPLVRTTTPSHEYNCEGSFDVARGTVDPDPSPQNTTLATSIVSLLVDFAELSSGGGQPRTEWQLENYMKVLKMELFTLLINNHFVLPVGQQGVERSLQNKMKNFIARWYDLGQALTVDEELHKEMKDAVEYYVSVGTNLTVQNLHDCLLKNYQIPIRVQHPMATIGEPPSWVHFPLKTLTPMRDSVSEQEIALWLNNFQIRKFLIHQQFLLSATKPLLGAYDFGEKLITYDVKIRMIIEMASQWKKIRCDYIRILNELAKSFEARKYWREIISDLTQRLLDALNADSRLAEDLNRRHTEITSEDFTTCMRVLQDARNT